MIHDLGQYLSVPLGLLIAAGHLADDPRPTALQRHECVQGVHRALAWRDDVRVAFLQAEAAPGSVVQRDAGIASDDSAPERRREAMNPGDGVALAIHHTE